MSEPGVAVTVVPHVELGVIRGDSPIDLVAHATAAANALAGVIKDRKLFSRIQGKEFVRCEGWTTLAAMMGVTPHEVTVTEDDGTFTATVELRRITDGQVIGRASAECGMDESLWAARSRNARRSMALTRAAAKACRLSFSWVMALAGYEVTPAEEMPGEETPQRPVEPSKSRGATTSPPKEDSAKSPLETPQGVGPVDFSQVPEALKRPDPNGEPMEAASEVERQMVNQAMESAGIAKFRLFYRHTFNRPFERLYKSDVKPLLDAVTDFRDLTARAGGASPATDGTKDSTSAAPSAVPQTAGPQ